MLANIAKPASCFSEGVRQGAVLLPASAHVPLTRLLLSCAATELKVALVTGLQPGSWIFYFLKATIFRDSSVALSPIVFSLLLPRLASNVPIGSPHFASDAFMFATHACRAILGPSRNGLLVLTSFHVSTLLSRAVIEVANFSQATRPHAHLAVQILAGYATSIVQRALHIVQEGQGRSSAEAPEDRDMLAQPILMLLHSPLLGLLASLQHVVIESSTSTNCWQFPAGSDVPPVHLLPARLLPDAKDSEVAMQVKHSLWVSLGCLRAY